MKIAFNHTPVMLSETLESLKLGKGKTVVDATVGGAGHSQQIATQIPGGILICIDKDQAAIEHSQSVLSKSVEGVQVKQVNQRKDDVKVLFAHDDFAHIAKVLESYGIQKVDAILADLGVSSHQLDTPDRGFSYMIDAPLDMRMDQTRGIVSAYHVVNVYPGDRLFAIIRDYGEERYARRIAEAIANARPIRTTLELAEVIKAAVPGNYYQTGGHPAKRTFQAIRIQVNGELDVIEKFIHDSIARLAKGGRIAIISFHSLEDRIVKHTFKTLATDCICPPRTPICICGHRATIKVLTKKPIEPSDAEQKANPRSHSAKLRVAEKI